MNRTTLRDVRQSRIPAAIGTCANNNDVLVSTVNEAQLRLLMDADQPDEGWWGTNAVMAFNVSRTGPYLTTPRGVARLTAVDLCKKPVVIRNQFYEYLEFGNGLRPVNCSGNPVCEDLMAFDRGVVTTFVDLTPPNKKIRVFLTDETDVGKTTLIGIKDSFGNIVYSQDGFNRVQGELLTLESPFSVTTNEVSEILGIQKDITNGQVQFYEWDTVTDESTLLLTMEPGETSACYRRYFFNGLPSHCCCPCDPDDTSGVLQVSAVVKLDYVPVVVDTDYLLIQNLAALKEACMSIRFGEIDTPSAQQMAEYHYNKSKSILFGTMDHFIGKERVSISVPLWNQDHIRKQPV